MDEVRYIITARVAPNTPYGSHYRCGIQFFVALNDYEVSMEDFAIIDKDPFIIIEGIRKAEDAVEPEPQADEPTLPEPTVEPEPQPEPEKPKKARKSRRKKA